MDKLELEIKKEKEKLDKLIKDNNFQLLDESILVQSRKVDTLIFLYLLLKCRVTKIR